MFFYLIHPELITTEPQLQDRTRSWGGIQKILSSTANNLIEENIEFIEFWAQILNAPPDAKVYIGSWKS